MSYELAVPLILLAIVGWIGWSSRQDTRRIDRMLARKRHHPAE